MRHTISCIVGLKVVNPLLGHFRDCKKALSALYANMPSRLNPFHFNGRVSTVFAFELRVDNVIQRPHYPKEYEYQSRKQCI